MKLTLLFLILVNAVFFAWSRWVDVSPEGVAVATPEPEADALLLYDEKYPPETDEVAVAVAVVEAEVAPDVEPVAAEPPAVDSPDPETPIAAVQAEPATETFAPDDEEAAPTPEALAREAVTAAAQTQVPTQASLINDGGPATTRCMTVGPFRELSVASDVASTLRASGLEPAAREQEAPLWVGHWVHLPPAGSRAAAVEVVEKLRADGVSDIYIEGAGPQRHAISLGLFSDVSRAETRAGKIRQLGVRPQIRDRYRDGTLHWVDIELAPGQQLNAQRFATLPDDDASLQERPCDTQAQGAD